MKGEKMFEKKIKLMSVITFLLTVFGNVMVGRIMNIEKCSFARAVAERFFSYTSDAGESLVIIDLIYVTMMVVLLINLSDIFEYIYSTKNTIMLMKKGILRSFIESNIRVIGALFLNIVICGVVTGICMLIKTQMKMLNIEDMKILVRVLLMYIPFAMSLVILDNIAVLFVGVKKGNIICAIILMLLLIMNRVSRGEIPFIAGMDIAGTELSYVNVVSECVVLVLVECIAYKKVKKMDYI